MPHGIHTRGSPHGLHTVDSDSQKHAGGYTQWNVKSLIPLTEPQGKIKILSATRHNSDSVPRVFPRLQPHPE